MKVLLLFAMVLVPALQSELKILDTPDGGIRPAPCAVTCSGVGRWDETGWMSRWLDSGSNSGKVYKKINLQDCNFISAPVVTVTAASGGNREVVCPSLTVWHANKSQFFVYSVEDTTASKMKNDQCNVYWSAFGYNC